MSHRIWENDLSLAN
jgi:hypothetical protein